MRVVITIEQDNAAFEDMGIGDETARILRRLAGDIVTGSRSGVSMDWQQVIDGKHNSVEVKLRDLNGNTCGTAVFSRE